MGTRSMTVFMDRETPICALYRQYDGYPAGHGAELAGILAGTTMVNGIGAEPGSIYNGMGDLAVRVISALKESIGGPGSCGGFYMEPIGSVGEHGEEYIYYVSGEIGSEPVIMCKDVYDEGDAPVCLKATEFLALVEGT